MDAINETSAETLPEEPSPFANDEDDLNLPPGRLHSTTRVKEKLSGSAGNINVPPGSFHSTGSGTTRRKPLAHHHDGTRSPRTRSRSPSMKERATTTTTTVTMGDSSISSLEDFVDNDILYDRQGLIDDLSQSSSKGMHPTRQFSNLPSVNERLSEDTLEDVHAFTDLAMRSSNASRTASVGTDRELFLDPLDEIDEEGLGDDASLEDPSETENQQIILTNMEKIAINDPYAEEASASALARGSSSVMDGEAATLPTA